MKGPVSPGHPQSSARVFPVVTIRNALLNMLIKVPSEAVGAAASLPTPVFLLDASPAFPTSLALFFEGDQIVDDAAREDLGPELLEHSSHLRAMQAKLPCAFVAG